MATRADLIEQTNLAFDFIQKLYMEVSYLIKEVEGILSEERFVIGKPGGYGITARRSSGLESTNVNLWLMRKFSVFFVPEERTATKGGQLETHVDDSLKVLYLRFVLNDSIVKEPVVFSGVFHSISVNPQAKWVRKFENLMGYLEYIDNKVFQNPQRVDYEDKTVKLKGKLTKNNLFDINDSEAIVERIVRPMLELYGKY